MRKIGIGKFSLTFGKEEEKTGFNYDFSANGSPRIELPVIREERSTEYIKYGLDNNYPRELLKLTETCAIHNAIVNSKSTMMAGKSILVDGKPQAEYFADATINEGAKLKAQLRQFEKVRHLLAKDYQHFGAYAYEIIYTLDFKRIHQINHVNVADLRSGKYIGGEVKEYYYSRNWKDLKKFPYEKIAAYDPTDKTNYRQLVYRCNYTPDQEYYGKPTYQAALAWIKLDSEIGLFHLSNIENGFFPGLHIAYYKNPENQEEKQRIIQLQKQQFQGAKNTGKTITTFSDGKDLAVDITPLQIPDLDKQFTLIGETVVQQIISAHRVTSPMLLGIATPGKLGYSSELATAQKIFESQVIAPERNMLEDDFNFIARHNGFSQLIELQEFNPLM